MALRWYVVHTYSGYENKVKLALEEKIKTLSLEDRITDVLIPSESVVELVKGERKTSNRKFYPGYILVKMELDDTTWHHVKSTPKVTGFIGSRTEPAIIPDEEAKRKCVARVIEAKPFRISKCMMPTGMFDFSSVYIKSGLENKAKYDIYLLPTRVSKGCGLFNIQSNI